MLLRCQRVLSALAHLLLLGYASDWAFGFGLEWVILLLALLLCFWVLFSLPPELFPAPPVVTPGVPGPLPIDWSGVGPQ